MISQELISAINKYNPYLFFHKKENSFPIPIEKYLSLSKLCDGEGKTLEENPTSKILYDKYVSGKADLHLEFKDPDWEEKLAGSPEDTSCYVRVVPVNETTFNLVYFYLFSHTEPYNCCMFGFPMKKYAHKADLKFIIVQVSKNNIEYTATKVYFGAHGRKAGMWKAFNDVERMDERPVAYSAKGDHSFYDKARYYPRIYFVAWDQCEKGHSTIPKVNIIFSKEEADFNADIHGWVYLPGQMNTDGIDAPAKQSFFIADVPSESNSPLKRLFCPDYF